MTFTRTNLLFLGAGFSVFARATALISHLVIVGILNRFQTPECCGIWLLLTQLVLFVSAFDLGIGGGGLRNELTRLNAHQNIDQPPFKEQHLFLSAVYFAFFLYAVFSILFGFGAFYFNWNLIFHINEEALGTNINLVMSVVAVCILLRVPFSISASGFYAYQETHLRALFEVIELSLLSLVVILASFMKASFFYLAISYYFMFFLLSIIGFTYFLRKRSWTFVKLSIAKIKANIQPLLKVNFFFWMQNIAGLALFSLNPLLISITNNVVAAGQFGLCQRLFSSLIGLHFILLNPLWTAYNDAYHKKDWVWLKKSFMQSLIFTGALFIGGGSIIILFYKPLFLLWTGRPFHQGALVIGFAIWALLYGCINCLSILLNSLNLIKNQVIFLLIGGFSNTILGLYLGKRYGSIGVIISAIIAMLPPLCSNLFTLLQVIKNIPKTWLLSSQESSELSSE